MRILNSFIYLKIKYNSKNEIHPKKTGSLKLLLKNQNIKYLNNINK